MNPNKPSINLLIILFSSLVLFYSCSGPAEKGKGVEVADMSDEELLVFSQELAHTYIITDGHIDLPYRIREERFSLNQDWLDVSNRTNGGDFDYPRAKNGGLDAPFMSIYTPSELQLTGGSKELADSLISLVEKITTTYPDKFALAKTPAEVEENFNAGLISLPMGMENGAPIGDDLANVEHFYNRGIRYITLTHGTDNLICDSSYDTTRTWNGLSDFGQQVVAEMNRLGIMIDISHVTDSAFYDVIAITEAPVIASHSSCRYFTPGFERNMSDDMIKKLGENGGVIQINFATSFLDGDLDRENEANEDKLKAILEEKGLQENDPEAVEIIENFKKENPYQFTNIQKVADHIDHVVELAGIDHVGFGSDFDGVGDSLPLGLKDVSGYPNIIMELLKRGYSEEDIQKICYQNVFRVWNKVIEVSVNSNPS